MYLVEKTSHISKNEITKLGNYYNTSPPSSICGEHDSIIT